MYERFNPYSLKLSPYLFFTGKGGVGKTSLACATAVALADSGKRVLLISTDPASNLQDVFGIELTNEPTTIKNVANLYAANLDPEVAAQTYKDKVIEPYRGQLPDAVLATMEEQLSGACTVEIAAFNEFSSLLTDERIRTGFDHILFDTAPTGHTLRLLQLPAAWSGFLKDNTHGASCLGPLAGLEGKKALYAKTVETLSDQQKTMLILVSRPDISPLKEAGRAAAELHEIGVHNQILVVNGILASPVSSDSISESFYNKQKNALAHIPAELKELPTFMVSLVPFNMTGLDHLRNFFKESQALSGEKQHKASLSELLPLQSLVQDLDASGNRIIFTMGKGGVGKTTVAAAIAVGLANEGHHVHLSTTDPASHLNNVLEQETINLKISRIDPVAELEKYRQEVISQNAEALDEDGLAFLQEDLQSPCTEEIAVFRAFAELVERSQEEIVVIDTAPTGHTLLLLDATQHFHREITRSTGNAPRSVELLLPRLRDSRETSVIIVTLPEATPFHEATRLQDDLKRAHIPVKGWVINQSFAATQTADPVLQARASLEYEWQQRIFETSSNCYLVPWQSDEIQGCERLTQLLSK